MSIRDQVVLLVGGVGGAKLALGLSHLLCPEQLTTIVNTGDDFRHLGLHVSPDIDTVTYTLAGLARREFGWGIEGDTRRALEMVARLGGPSWFGLGDADLGTNLYRSLMLHEGETLTGATGRIARALDVAHPILPMTDDPVRTMLDTDQGTLGFQEYFVRERWQPLVRAIRFEGAEKAVPSPQVADALKRATLILIGPSNPFLSIDPILSITGLRAMIKESPAPCVAVSPIVGGKAIKGPAAKLMDELGLEVSPLGVAFHYEDHLNGFILDTVDSGFLPEISALGIRSAARNTLMTTAADKQELGAFILDWTEENLT